MKKRLLPILICCVIMFCFTGCEFTNEGYLLNSFTENTSNDNEEEQNNTTPITYLAMLYDNNGNNFLNFQGNNFEITPNKVTKWGYSTGGSWHSYYETSSVVTINVDGNYIETCGSTVLFKDTRLEMYDVGKVLDTGTDTIYSSDSPVKLRPTSNMNEYLSLRYWWKNLQEKGQNGSKIILIQSQDGYNIGAFIGNDVTWELAGKLPKTTKIVIDGKELYIHRCNFTIIDTNLIDKD